MSESEFEGEILARVDVDRRTFVKRAILGSAFAVPIIASFEMGTLSAAAKSAQSGNGVKGGYPSPYPPPPRKDR